MKVQNFAYGTTVDGRGVVVFMGATEPPKKMAQFIKACEGVVPVMTVVTPLGLGVTHEDDDDETFYCEAGDFLSSRGEMPRLDEPVEITAVQ